MNDFVKRLQNARNWFNRGQCCGQVDSLEICCAPACIFGEALKEFSQAAARIAKLEAENASLAANQCLHGIRGDEGSSPYCPRIAELKAALNEGGKTLDWCARKMKDLCASRDDVAAAELAASRAFDAIRKAESRAALEGKGNE